MRDHLFKCLTSKAIERFRKKQREINEKPISNHFKFNSLVINLSNRTITETEKTVLELGLTFCPSQKNFNKEGLSLVFFSNSSDD